MAKIVPRGHTACADAYLTPCIKEYLEGFCRGFDEGISDGSVKVKFMQSDGGLSFMDAFSGAVRPNRRMDDKLFCITVVTHCPHIREVLGLNSSLGSRT